MFSGEDGDGDLGTTARSYLRQVAAWERMTKLGCNQQALVLYQHLQGAASVNAELDVDRLGDLDSSAPWTWRSPLSVAPSATSFASSNAALPKLSATMLQSSIASWLALWSVVADYLMWPPLGFSWTAPTWMRPLRPPGFRRKLLCSSCSSRLPSSSTAPCASPGRKLDDATERLCTTPPTPRLPMRTRSPAMTRHRPRTPKRPGPR